MPKRAETNSDGIPLAEIDEITDRIDIIEAEIGVAEPVEKITDDGDLSAILASFEVHLLELNRELEDEASGKIKALRSECAQTRYAVAGLNSALNDQLKGDT